MKALIRSIRWEAHGIHVYVLEPLAGHDFAPFDAGAHVDVSLSDGLRRSYSLVNSPAERNRYEIAVQLSTDSRGGSRQIHERFRVGEVIEISAPKNSFPLNESAPHSVLIAGGIGVTPLMSMIHRLETLKRPWTLHYAVASRDKAAFLQQLSGEERAHIHFHSSPVGERLNIANIVAAAPIGAHFYCCGPARMLDGFLKATKALPAGTAHIEYFTADTEVATDGNYEVVLCRSGKTLKVEPGQSLLDVLLAAGVNVAFACAEGICGTCETGVIEGIPDHRDHFLTDEDKATNRRIMVCCSGSKSSRLVLDL